MSELRVDTITDELGTGSPDFPNGITVSNATFGTIDIGNSTLTSSAISGSTIESTPIGQVTPAAGDFTTLTASGDVNFDSGTLFVDASENKVGIGTTSPSEKLHLENGSEASYVRTSNTNAPNGFDVGAGSSGSAVLVNRNNTDMIFFTNSSERMRIDSSGNVGIGATSPDNFAGGGLTLGTTSAGKSIIINSSVNGGNGVIQFIDLNGNQALQINGNANDAAIYGFGDRPMRFFTDGAERMRIDSSGNVLFGTTTELGDGFTIRENGGDLCLTVNTTSRTATTTLQQYRNPNGTVGQIQTAGTSTSYLTSSDYRLKENIQPLTGALNKVQAMNPVTYDWKAGGEGEGFIAHELQEIAPYAVSGEKDGEDMQGVDYGKLTTLLAGAVKELTAKVEQLEAQLNAN